MFCPTCNTQNLATNVRCMQCGTTLIYEAEGHSSAYKHGAMMVDRRIYSGVGAFLGFCISALLLHTVLESFVLNERGVYALGIAVGGISGRMLAWHKWRNA